jgi:hypothetical protein
MACFRFQVNYLYGKISLTFLKLILFMVTEQALCEILCQPKYPISPHYSKSSPTPHGMAALHSLLKENSSTVKITITSFKAKPVCV